MRKRPREEILGSDDTPFLEEDEKKTKILKHAVNGDNRSDDLVYYCEKNPINARCRTFPSRLLEQAISRL